VRGVVVDTTFFTGNYPPSASVEGCGVDGYPGPAELDPAGWLPLVPRSPLRGDDRNLFPVEVPYRLTHVRLRIYPDGGVSRLRVHGEPVADPRFLRGNRIDLAALEHGGSVTACSNMFYGAPTNLLRPGLARVMGDGWETARRRDSGNDWVVVRLAAAGRVHVAELDTSHFKGNAPAEAALRGVDARVADPAEPQEWFEVLPRTRLQPDTRHRFLVPAGRPATHVRLDVYPDGGLARLRLYGEVDEPALAELDQRWSALRPPGAARPAI
jgi:allantoicase